MNYSLLFNLYCCKSVFQICNNIINVLSTNRKTNCVLSNSLVCKLCLVELTVSCRSRMNHQRLNISNVGKKTENLKIVDKLPGFFTATFNVESEN